MEVKGLNEVIPLHFSIPIVSVMLLLGLVFACGFKSPSQPPSFDFDDEKKGDQQGGKKKKRKKKSEASKQMTSEISKEIKEMKKEIKPKKAPKAKKQVSSKAAPVSQKENVDFNEPETGDNEWSTVSSRKDKKNKQTTQGNVLQENITQQIVEPVLIAETIKATEAAINEEPAPVAEKMSKKRKGKKKKVENDQISKKQESKNQESPIDGMDSVEKTEEEKTPAVVKNKSPKKTNTNIVTDVEQGDEVVSSQSKSPKKTEKKIGDDANQGEEIQKSKSPKKTNIKNVTDVEQGGEEVSSQSKSPKKTEKKIGDDVKQEDEVAPVIERKKRSPKKGKKKTVTEVEKVPPTEIKNSGKEQIRTEVDEASVAPPQQTMTDSSAIESKSEAVGTEAIVETVDDAKKSKKKSKKKKKGQNSEDPTEKQQVLEEASVNSNQIESNIEQRVRETQPASGILATDHISPSQSKNKNKKGKNKSKSSKEPSPPEVSTEATPLNALSGTDSSHPQEAVPVVSKAMTEVQTTEPETPTEEKKGNLKDSTKPKKKKVRRDL